MATAFGDEHNLPDAILPAEGIQVFDRILSSDLTEVVVSTRELAPLLALARPDVPIAAPSDATAAAARPASASPGRSRLSASFVAPASETERTIAEVWQELLGIEPIGIEDDFFEAGGHSLLATQVMSRLHQRLGLDVPLRTLFEARTIAVFAARVDELARGAGEDREEIEL
jgi:acyl carrier protein